MDDAYNYVKYSFPYGNKTYNLLSMDIKMYRTWRDERLQTKNDEEKAKKKEVEAAALLHVPVQSMEETADTTGAESIKALTPHIFLLRTDLKPRTVSPEGKEDDMAASINTIVDVTLEQKLGAVLGRPNQCNKNKLELHVHGFYGQWCMHNYLGRSSFHACTIDVSASYLRANTQGIWSGYFQHRRRGCLLKEKIKHMRYDLFLFLPMKEHAWQGISVQDQLSLKSIGWGPPTEESPDILCLLFLFPFYV
jgi:hypothetical protein